MYSKVIQLCMYIYIFKLFPIIDFYKILTDSSLCYTVNLYSLFYVRGSHIWHINELLLH